MRARRPFAPRPAPATFATPRGGARAGRERVGIAVTAGAAAALRRGHPWVWATQVTGGLEGRTPGDVALVHDDAGRAIGPAIVDPGSPLAARMWGLDPARPLDDALVAARVERAIAVRDRFLDASTTALRWVHGEGDRCPGLVLDRYADVAVLRLDGAAMEAWSERLAAALFPQLEARGIRSLVGRITERGAERGAPRGESTKIRLLRGEAPPEVITVQEHGVPFAVDLAHGQKTGAFLDQRDNRVRVGRLARGRRVLNLFSYAGGFSLHAALGGASACTSVDVAAGAHATAQRSFQLAGVPLEPHAFVTADVWQFLERARARGEKWDLVISDPPNMAPNEGSRARAIAAYEKLHAACAGVLADGGVLCAASCSSHVRLEDFLGTLDERALGGHELRVVEIVGAGADHPVLPAFPEGRYLKFCVLA